MSSTVQELIKNLQTFPPYLKVMINPGCGHLGLVKHKPMLHTVSHDAWSIDPCDQCGKTTCECEEQVVVVT